MGDLQSGVARVRRGCGGRRLQCGVVLVWCHCSAQKLQCVGVALRWNEVELWCGEVAVCVSCIEGETQFPGV